MLVGHDGAFFMRDIVDRVRVYLFRAYGRNQGLIGGFFPGPVTGVIVTRALFGLVTRGRRSYLSSCSFVKRGTEMTAVGPLNLYPQVLV